MNKAYIRINWINYPNISTPLNEINLNTMDLALETIDARVVDLDNDKLDANAHRIVSWEIDNNGDIIVTDETGKVTKHIIKPNIATSKTTGIVKPDDDTIKVDNAGTLTVQIDSQLSTTSKLPVENQTLSNVLTSFIDTTPIDNAFYKIFSKVQRPINTQALTTQNVNNAINTTWSGQSSSNPNALNSSQVANAVNTTWNGASSTDPGAIQSYQINNIVNNLQ